MRHVTDGELHALLDGSLDLLPSARGEEVRDHLSSCSACQERLQDEEVVREQAQSLLRSTAPEEVSLPSFEEIRARAEASATSDAEGRSLAPHRRLLQGVPLAWAATIVVALGVGWMGGQLAQAPPEASPIPGEPLNPALRPASASDRASEAEDQAPLRAELGRKTDARSDIPPTEEREPTTVGGLVEGVGQAQAGVETPLQDSGAPERGTVAVAEGPSEKARAEDLPTPEGLAPEARREMLDVMRSEAVLPVAPSLPQEEDPVILLRSRTVAEESALAIPGLEVITVEWEEWIPGERGLHIRQLLPMGDTLELRYLGLLMGTDPEAAEYRAAAEGIEEEALERPLSPKVLEVSLPPGWNQVVMRRGRGWLVARAPLSEDSLRALLRSLR